MNGSICEWLDGHIHVDRWIVVSFGRIEGKIHRLINE